MAEQLRILADDRMNADTIPADETAAIGGCLDKGTPTSHGGTGSATRPPDVSQLVQEWDDAVG